MTPVAFGVLRHSTAAICEIHERRALEQLVAVLGEELERALAHRDDEIELPSAILQAQKLSERVLIVVLRKSPLVDELGVIVQSFRQSFLEDPGDFAIADGHDLRVAAGRVQDEYFLGFLNRTCRIDGERHADRDHDSRDPLHPAAQSPEH